MQHQQAAVCTLLNNLGQSRSPPVHAQQEQAHPGWRVSSDAQQPPVRGLLRQNRWSSLRAAQGGTRRSGPDDLCLEVPRVEHSAHPS